MDFEQILLLKVHQMQKPLAIAKGFVCFVG
jgi:hypothetical protein